MFEQDKIIDDWNNHSDEYFSKTKFDELFFALEKDPYKGFPHAMAEMIKEYYPDLKGKNVCVPSCGDNTAVFGFCALGANVTATDISYKQIENARKVAEERNLNIKYHVSDSMKLSELSDNTYDLVYTSNGVHVWINDLNAMYSNIYRILKKAVNIYFLIHIPLLDLLIKKFIREFLRLLNAMKTWGHSEKFQLLIGEYKIM